MNRKIGMFSCVINFVSIIGFAFSMLIGFNSGSYFCSMFIAFTFIPMMYSYAYFSETNCKLSGYISAGFATVYATIILLVYFAQLTTLRLDDLTEQTVKLLDFQQFGLFFNYDLLGYGIMALATFFAGLTINVQSTVDKWLKYLLLIHGMFFISGLILPMLGIFKADSPAWIGVVVLEIWCLYFSPISIFSFFYFSKSDK